jgi:hypothetical protein
MWQQRAPIQLWLSFRKPLQLNRLRIIITAGTRLALRRPSWNPYRLEFAD